MSNERDDLEFERLDPRGRATLEDVVSAIIALGRYDELELFQLVSGGKLQQVFPFRLRTSISDPIPELDRWEDVVKAPSRALTDDEYEGFLRGEAPGRASSADAASKAPLARFP